MRRTLFFTAIPVVLILLTAVIGTSFVSKQLKKQTKIITPLSNSPERFWAVQSVDTMKFSRDTAREMLTKPEFDIVIEQQISDIAKTGATHVAIGTPYDEEFVPFLKRWVAVARKYNLNVWYRGNFSGWEGWFEYKKIGREEHLKLTEAFIKKHPDLFEDGDIFVSCPECENGGPGDPRMNGDAEGHKKFLIEEYILVKKLFADMDKHVIANYYSMNGDVARLIMDRKTTKALDGVIAIDHYVKSSRQLLTDISEYAKQSGGRVVLGEWGAPIPDIHGPMTEEEQAAYIDESFKILLESDDIEAINYWVSRGGSTELWKSENEPKLGAAALTKYFKPYVIRGTITDPNGRKLDEITITTTEKTALASDGEYSIGALKGDQVTVIKQGYTTATFTPFYGDDNEITYNVTLEKIDKTMWDHITDLL